MDQGGSVHLRARPLLGDYVALSAAFIGITWVVVGLRWWARRVINGWGWDDTTIVLATFLYSFHGGAVIALGSLTSGKTNFTLDDIRAYVDLLIIIETTYLVTVEVLKISLGLYFLRIFHERWQRWTIYYMLALITVISTVYFFLIIFQCGTPKGAFEHMASQGTQGKCLNHVVIYGFGYAHNTINSLADVLFVLLGLYVIHSSLIRKRDQVIVGFILCLGVMGSIATFIRFRYIHLLGSISTEFLQNAKNIGMWSSLECGMGITAVCLATLRPIFRSSLQVLPWRRSRVDTTAKETDETGTSPRHRASDMAMVYDRMGGYPKHIAADRTFQLEEWPVRTTITAGTGHFYPER